jgi:hypothetical protein
MDDGLDDGRPAGWRLDLLPTGRVAQPSWTNVDAGESRELTVQFSVLAGKGCADDVRLHKLSDSLPTPDRADETVAE